jgi:ribonuclease PH
VLTGTNGNVEVQGTAEGDPFSRDQFNELLDLAEKGVSELVVLQKQALGL